MLIAEELMLLLTQDDGTADGWGTHHSYAYNAAVVTDLIRAERVGLSDDKDPRVRVISPAPTGHPVLDHSLEQVVEKDGRRLSSSLHDHKLDPTAQVVQSLTAAGVITVEPKRMLGLVPEKRLPADAGPETALRERLRAVLRGASPEVDEAVLLSLLQGLGRVREVLTDETDGMGTKEIEARVEEVSADVGHGGSAVADAVSTMTTAMMTAVFVPIIVSGGSS